MLKYCVFIAGALFVLNSCRTLTPEEQALKQQKKEIQMAVDSVNFRKADSFISEGRFVLEADEISFKRGNRVIVDPNRNYIAVTGDEAVVQIAPYNGGGPNGMGGITVEGRVSNMVSKTDKRGNQIYTFSVNGTSVSSSVMVTLFKNSTKASAYISPNFNSQNVTLSGKIVDLESSNILFGTPSI